MPLLVAALRRGAEQITRVDADEQAAGPSFQRVTSRSQNSLLRVTFFDKTVVNAVRDALERLGSSTEYVKSYNLLAINTPGDVVLETVQN